MALYKPLEPNVTFGQEDPAYWQLHRFIHWEEVREAIPRRRPNGRPRGDSKQRDYFNEKNNPFNTLSKGRNLQRPPEIYNPAVDAYLIEDPPKFRPIDRRERIIRKQYREQFKLPDWMFDDLDRRPSPKKDVIHPWDLNPPPSTGQSQNSQQPAGASNTNRMVRLLSPDDPKRQHDKGGDGHRRHTTVSANDPNVGKLLDSIKERNAKGSATKTTDKIRGEGDGGGKSKEEKKSGRMSRSTTKNSIDSANSKAKKEKKMTARQRVLKEFHDKRKPKPKKKYLPMSKRIIKPPKERESYDDVGSTIGDVFNSNKDFRPGTRINSTMTSEEDADESVAGASSNTFTGRSRASKVLTKVTKAAINKKKASVLASLNQGKPFLPAGRGSSSLSVASSKMSRPRSILKKNLAPLKTTKLPSARPPTLNKYKALPAISKKTSTLGVGTMGDAEVGSVNSEFEATVAGAMTRKWVDASSQVGTFDVGVNTEKEQRNVGISTQDDVIYIYETIEVSRRHKHRKKNHQHRHRDAQEEKPKRHHQHRHHRKSPSVSSSERSSRLQSRSRSESGSASNSKSSRNSSVSLKASPKPKHASKHSGPASPNRPAHLKRKDVNEADLKKQILSQLKFAERHQTQDLEESSPEINKPETAPHQPISRLQSMTKQPLSRTSSHPSKTKEPVSHQPSAHQTLSRVSSIRQPISKRDSLSPPHTATSNHSSVASSITGGQAIHSQLSTKLSSNNQVKQKNSNSKNSGHASLGRTVSNSSTTTTGRSGSRPRQGSAASSTDSVKSGTVISNNNHSNKTTPRGQHPPLNKTNSVNAKSLRDRHLSVVHEGDNSPIGQDYNEIGQQLEVCKFCHRRFASQRLTVHEVTCQKTQTKKRKVFDSRNRRLSTFAGEDKSIVEHSIHSQTKKANAPPKKASQWRSQHEAFIEQIRYAKNVTELEKTGGDIRTLGPAPKTFTGDLEPCPKCGRKFNAEAIKRHVPVCKAEPVAKRK